MKHVRSIAVIFATGLAAAGTASAQDMYKSGVGGLYAGLNYTFMNLESGNADADVGTLSAKVGVMATPYLGIEARGGFGVDDERIGGVDFSSTISLAATPPSTWPTNRRLRLTPFSVLPGWKSKPPRSWAQRPRTKRMCPMASV